MSTPDSAHPAVLLPVLPRLTLVPTRVTRPSSAWRSIESLPPTLVAAAGLVAILTVALVGGRVLAVSLSQLLFVDSTQTATAFGALSFLSIVAISAAIVLAHTALRSAGGMSAMARQATAIFAGAAYLHLVLWFTRVVVAALAVSSSGGSGLFLPNLFWLG